MEPETILVMVLGAGVGALLVWFEINSRRNERSKKPASTLAQSALVPLQKRAHSDFEPDAKKTKAA